MGTEGDYGVVWGDYGNWLVEELPCLVAFANMTVGLTTQMMIGIPLLYLL